MGIHLVISHLNGRIDGLNHIKADTSTVAAGSVQELFVSHDDVSVQVDELLRERLSLLRFGRREALANA